MKLITPFTILNKKFREINLNRESLKNRRLATDRLHEDHSKIYKNHQLAYNL